jgi:sialate O-acetylesterase
MYESRHVSVQRFLQCVGVWGVVAAFPALADVRLPAIFSDHAVLQQGVALPVWGWADPGEEVAVSLAGQTRAAKAGADGAWRVTFDALKPGAALTLTAKGKNAVTVQDVLVGEVWLGSGQSNMGFAVNRAFDFEKEKAAAVFPEMRMFNVARKVADAPQADCEGQWVVCSPETVGTFSATLYFTVREIHQTLKVPVGGINSSWGGTPIQAWMSAETLQDAAFKPITDPWEAQLSKPWDKVAAMAGYDKQVAAWKANVEKAKAAGKTPPRAPQKPDDPRLSPHRPSNLFNAMIAPLVPYAIKGAVWYQGESNSGRPNVALYGALLESKITDWRKRWGSDFAYGFVQLPNFTTGSDWPCIREQFLNTLKLPKTGMAVTIDIGEHHDIHPRNKQDVGRRLAQWALGEVYGRPVASTCGPLPAGHAVRGAEVVCRFTHADGGLVAKGGGALTGFTLAGADKKFVPASARIEGGTVVVSSPDVQTPVAVRYAWENDPVCNLFNGAGLPASPFRTDTFDLSVQGR